MSKHSPEPWYFYENDSYCEINSERDGQIGDSCASSCLGDKELGRANANRIVTCVNACVGMEDPAAEIEKLKRQRDELLALARAVVCHSTVKDVMGVKCAAFPWTEYEILGNKVKEIADES